MSELPELLSSEELFNIAKAATDEETTAQQMNDVLSEAVTTNRRAMQLVVAMSGVYKVYLEEAGVWTPGQGLATFTAPGVEDPENVPQIAGLRVMTCVLNDDVDAAMDVASVAMERGEEFMSEVIGFVITQVRDVEFGTREERFNHWLESQSPTEVRRIKREAKAAKKAEKRAAKAQKAQDAD